MKHKTCSKDAQGLLSQYSIEAFVLFLINKKVGNPEKQSEISLIMFT